MIVSLSIVPLVETERPLHYGGCYPRGYSPGVASEFRADVTLVLDQKGVARLHEFLASEYARDESSVDLSPVLPTGPR